MLEERPLLEVLDELVNERESWNQRAGENLRELRKAAGFTQSSFASLVGSTQPYVSHVENGGGISTESLTEWRSALATAATGGGTASGNDTTSKVSAKASIAKARKGQAAKQPA